MSRRLDRLVSIFSVTSFMLLTAGFPLTVVLHEAGHLAGALLAGGFEILTIKVFPLTWQRTPQGWVQSRSWKEWAAEAGRVVVQPTSMPGLRRRALFFMAGGPVASLLGCVGSAGLLAEIVRRGAEGQPIGQFLLVIGTAHLAMHGITVFLTLIPLKKLPGGTLPTDGWNLLNLARGNPVTMSHWASHVVVRTLRAGKPLAEALDGKSLEQWARREKASGYLHFLLLIEALDRSDIASARALVSAALNGKGPKRPRPHLDRTHDFLAHFIVLAALTEHNPDAAGSALARLETIQGAAVRPPLAIARAALAAAQGDAAAVRQALGELDAFLAASPFPAAVQGAYRWARATVETAPKKNQ